MFASLEDMKLFKINTMTSQNNSLIVKQMKESNY